MNLIDRSFSQSYPNSSKQQRDSLFTSQHPWLLNNWIVKKEKRQTEVLDFCLDDSWMKINKWKLEAIVQSYKFVGHGKKGLKEISVNHQIDSLTHSNWRKNESTECNWYCKQIISIHSSWAFFRCHCCKISVE